jgi:hypothetical protein
VIMSYTEVSMNPRERAYELVDCGLIDAKTMLLACLGYMDFDMIEDMLRMNQFEEVSDED